MDVWSLVHGERWALIRDLSRIDDEMWQRPSLCAAWSVHDVAAHLVMNAKVTWFGLARDLIRARFDLDRLTARGVARERGATPRETLERLRRVAHRRTGPPAPLDSRLVEEVVHGEDIRRPLGLDRAYQVEAVVRALRHQARTRVEAGGARQRVAGLRLRATDADVSIGDGPEVTGPALSLLMAISGRSAAADDLAGPGVAHLP